MNVILSVFIWLFTAIMTILVFLAALFIEILLFPFDKKRKIAHAQGFWWAGALIAINPFWRLSVSGLENIDPQKTYVIIGNHQSLADIVLVYKTRMQFKWMAKDVLFRIPIFGWTMLLMKYIRLARGEYASIKKSYDYAAGWLRKDVSVLFFPEGTRSTSEEVGVFKNGAFKLAIQEKKPILPIAISGARNLIPRGSWVFKSVAHAVLKVLPAVETEGLSAEEFASLRDNLRKIIRDNLEEANK